MFFFRGNIVVLMKKQGFDEFFGLGLLDASHIKFAGDLTCPVHKIKISLQIRSKIMLNMLLSDF